MNSNENPQILKINARGLSTQSNLLSAPPGSLVNAVNVVIDRDNVLEIRRGVEQFGQIVSPTSGVIESIYNYDDHLIIHSGDTLTYDSSTAHSGIWEDYIGSYAEPSGSLKIRSAQSNKNIYFTTDAGIVKLDDIDGPILSAGIPRGLDGKSSQSGAVGFWDTTKNVAYRIAWTGTDANENLLIGSPSQRIIQPATSGVPDSNVSITFTVPDGITTDHTYRVYRSPMSADDDTEPSDDMYQIVETHPTAGELVTKTITFLDTTPDEIRAGGTPLYTNSGQEGILQSNDTPPIATDMCLFGDYMFYANTKTKEQFELTLISVDGSGLIANDTIDIDGTTYTGKAVENTAAGQFLVNTTGTVSDNIDITANSLVRTINRYPTNTSIYAYYSSGYNEVPGRILLEERVVSGNPFTVQSDRSSAWTPNILTDVNSINNEGVNFIRWSKQQQPEAVPQNGTNFLRVGSANKAIKRIIPLNDAIIILKEDGLYRLAGNNPANFSIFTADPTLILKAPESAVTLANQVVCYTNQGVVMITDGGTVQVRSRPVEFDLFTLGTYTGFENNTIGISYESDRKYIMPTVSDSTDIIPTQAYTYNYITDSWTTWEWDLIDPTCGLVNPTDGLLYLGSSDGYIYKERKGFSKNDYTDGIIPITIVSSLADVVTLSSTTGLVADYLIKQRSRSSQIVSVDSSTEVTVTDTVNWFAGAASAYIPIRVTVKYAPEHCGNPNILKHFSDCILSFRQADFDALELTFTADTTQISNDKTIINSKRGGLFGGFTFGNVPFGGSGAGNLQDLRLFVPRNQARCHWLNLEINFNQALQSFGIQSLGYVFSDGSTRFRS